MLLEEQIEIQLEDYLATLCGIAKRAGNALADVDTLKREFKKLKRQSLAKIHKLMARPSPSAIQVKERVDKLLDEFAVEDVKDLSKWGPNFTRLQMALDLLTNGPQDAVEPSFPPICAAA